MATDADEKARGFIAMELNYLIYTDNMKQKLPSLKHLRNLLNLQERIEQEIAQRNNKMMAHLAKWDKVREWTGT